MSSETFNIGGGGSNNLGLAFLFNPQPLVFNGQSVAPNLIFSEPQVAGQVDQASQAYAFTLWNINNTQNFVANVSAQTQGFALPIFNSIVASLGAIGNTEAQAMQTAANNLNKNSGHGLLGFLGL